MEPYISRPRFRPLLYPSVESAHRCLFHSPSIGGDPPTPSHSFLLRPANFVDTHTHAYMVQHTLAQSETLFLKKTTVLCGTYGMRRGRLSNIREEEGKGGERESGRENEN